MSDFDEMAKKAGFSVEADGLMYAGVYDGYDCRQDLMRFAALVRSKALEEAGEECIRGAYASDGRVVQIEQGVRELCRLSIRSLRVQ